VALDLSIDVSVKSGNAKKDLADIEQGIQGVEKAAAKSSDSVGKSVASNVTWWQKEERSLTDVTKALGGHATQSANVVQASVKMTDASKAVSGALSAEAQAFYNSSMAKWEATKATNALAAESKIAAEEQAALNEAVMISTAGMQALVYVLVALAAVGVAELKFLYDSAKLYAEKTGKLDEYSASVENIKSAWENMQYAVGAALLTNSGDFNVWLGLLKLGLDNLGGYIAAFVIKIQAEFALVALIVEKLAKAAEMLPGGRLIVGAGRAVLGDVLSAGQAEAARIKPFVADETYYSTTKGGYQSPFAFGNAGPLGSSGNGPTRAAAELLRGGRSTRASAPFVIPNMGLTLGGIAMGAFGLPQEKPTAPAEIPDLKYNLLGGIPSMFNPNDPRIWTPKPEAPAQAVSPFRDAFAKFGQELPDLLFSALKTGGVAGLIGGVAAGLGSIFSDQFTKALGKVGGDFSKLGGSTQAMGVAGMGLGVALGGYALGQQYGKAKGALGGAAAGAMAGTMIMPGIGTAIGAGIGALAGFFGGRSADKKAAQQMAEDQAALLAQYGGMEKLKELAQSLGVSIGNAFDTKKPAQFKTFVDSLNTALEKHKTLLEGIAQITSGVNARAQVFGTTASAGSQAEFNRVGAMAAGAFGANVQTAGGPLGALAALKPTLDVITQAQKTYNFTASETVQRLLDINAAVQAQLPAFQALEADSQILQGALKANWRDMDLFAATSADVAMQIGQIVAKGMPMAQALALNQPVLQSLWEAQQKFGFQTDEATKALLEQAVAQGIVGPQMRDVNQQILDVLLAIGRVLGADIPNALAALPGAAQNAANGMNAAMGSVKLTGDAEGPDVGTSSDVAAHSGGYLVRGMVLHAGGLVPWRVAHRGGLGPDEFPIVAQSGEFMMRRSAVNKFGLNTLRQMNAGQAPNGGGHVTQNLSVTVHGDVTTKNVDELALKIAKRIDRGGPVRTEWQRLRLA
jgi:hypothetical protein